MLLQLSKYVTAWLYDMFPVKCIISGERHTHSCE